MKAPAALVLAVSFLTTAAQEPPPPLPAPDPSSTITEAYAAYVAGDAYFWAWPMLASYTRRLAASRTTDTVLAGPFPRAPLNHLGMSTEVLSPSQRSIASPDQNLICGMGIAALDRTPVVLQVPDLGDEFWLYQCLDARGDSFCRIGSMHPYSTGLYLLVGPDWKGKPPDGIPRVFRSSTGTATIVPCVYTDGTEDQMNRFRDKLGLIGMYPLSEYDGRLKTVPWVRLPRLATTTADVFGDVKPETVFDILADALEDAPARPTEDGIYARALAVLAAAQQNPKLKSAIIRGAKRVDEELVKPLFEYQNVGRQVYNRWHVIENSGAFGTDYFTRTAAARSMSFRAAQTEVAVFALDTDSHGNRLVGEHAYTVTFTPDQLPAGTSWSLSLYDPSHFVVPNELNRYSLGPNRADRKAPSGPLTMYIQAERPAADSLKSWLPAPRGEFSLVLRVYGPQLSVFAGTWAPPAVVLVR